MVQERLLIIDTSRSGIDLALAGGETAAGHVDSEKQSVDLPTAVQNFIARNGLTFSDLSAVAVVVGPGSFTGIRLGIAYARGLSIGLTIPVIPLNAFEIYWTAAPDAFVAIDSKRGDFFAASPMHAPCAMTIDAVESEQMSCPRTVGHQPYDLRDAAPIVLRKFKSGAHEAVIPMYLRPHYAEARAPK
jgi:tRNA threonylcarbamoyl adenosine modification protein YeaZ